MYVCVKKGDVQERDEVVGTIYLQFQKSDFKEKAEIGQLTVSPKWQKNYEISQRMLKVAEEEAIARKFSCLYLYLVGPVGGHNQAGLQRFYEKQGYYKVAEKLTAPNPWYITPGTPDGRSPRIIMNKAIPS